MKFAKSKKQLQSKMKKGANKIAPLFLYYFNILQGNRAPVPAPQVFGSRDKGSP